MREHDALQQELASVEAAAAAAAAAKHNAPTLAQSRRPEALPSILSQGSSDEDDGLVDDPLSRSLGSVPPGQSPHPRWVDMADLEKIHDELLECREQLDQAQGDLQLMEGERDAAVADKNDILNSYNQVRGQGNMGRGAGWGGRQTGTLTVRARHAERKRGGKGNEDRAKALRKKQKMEREGFQGTGKDRGRDRSSNAP